MGWIILAIVVILVIAIISMYNGLVSSRVKVDNAWSQIDVQLQRRFDLIPNFVETVNGTGGLSHPGPGKPAGGIPYVHRLLCGGGGDCPAPHLFLRRGSDRRAGAPRAGKRGVLRRLGGTGGGDHHL